MTAKVEVGIRSGRHYGLDWLRIAAFGLLILYHLGMYFAVGDWLIKSDRPVVWASWLMAAVQPWRMPLLFAVSGFATFHLFSRSPSAGQFLARRSSRLLLPLLFGMVVLVPPQSWVRLVSHDHYPFSFAHFLVHDWGRSGFAGAVPLPPTEHLWFLAYLWTYTLLLFALIAWRPEWLLRRAAAGWAALAGPARLFWAPLLLLLPLRLVLLFSVPERHGFLHDWVSDLVYFPAFGFGFLLAARPSLWEDVLMARRPATLAAGAAILLVAALEILFPLERGHGVQALDRAAQLVAAWAMILLLFGLADRHLRRDHPLRARLGAAVFPFYLVHQTAIVLIAFALAPWGLGNGAMFVALLAGTLAASILFHEAGRRIPWLAPFVGLSAPAAPRLAGQAQKIV